MPTDFALIRIKNDSFLFVFLEPGKNAICVCNIINPRVSFMFSLVWLSSAAFCDFIADIVQKLRTLLVRSTHFFPCPRSKRTRIRTQDSLHIAHERCQLYDKHPYCSCFSLVIAKLILTSACSWRDIFLMPPCWNLNKFYAKLLNIDFFGGSYEVVLVHQLSVSRKTCLSNVSTIQLQKVLFFLKFIL